MGRTKNSKRTKKKTSYSNCKEVVNISMEGREDICELIQKEVPSNTPECELHPSIRDIISKIDERTTLNFALSVLEGKSTHPNMNLNVYKAGVVLCVVIIADHFRDGTIGVANSMGVHLKRHFEPRTCVFIIGLWKRLNIFLENARVLSVEDGLPAKMNVRMLPLDAPHIWNDDRGRIINAVEAIEFVDADQFATEMVFLISNMKGGLIKITTIKNVVLTVPLTCGICYNPATEFDMCGKGHCRYLICKSCRCEIPDDSCPFCRQTWD